MKYGYARVSTDGQSVAAQVAQLRGAGCDQVFREVEARSLTAARSDVRWTISPPVMCWS
jgi:DNA invertase Pin-like site-specific DNA recombinase